MALLTDRPVNRLFAFGCSFTKYSWTTWPEIVAEDLNVREYYNLASPSAGNEFIFNRLMQVDRLFDLTEDDLVMICWTSVNREDRFVNRQWLMAGNIYTQDIYPRWFVDAYYSNPEDALLHDFAYIRAARIMLQHRQVQSHLMQMSDLSQNLDDWFKYPSTGQHDFSRLIDDELSYLKPSFFKVLWDNDLSNRIRVDPHPSPIEHFTYLDRIFNHDWEDATLRKVEKLEDEHREGFQEISTFDESRERRFSHLRFPSSIDGIF